MNDYIMYLNHVNRINTLMQKLDNSRLLRILYPKSKELTVNGAGNSS